MNVERRRARHVTSLIEQHPFAGFVAIAYAFSWTSWGVAYAGGGDVPFLIGALGPAVAAYVVLHLTGGSLRGWARSCVRWRVPVRWWAYALGLPAALYGAVSLTLQLIGHPVDWSLAMERAPAYASTWLFVLALGGALEEPGWRGFALDELCQYARCYRITAFSAPSLLQKNRWVIPPLPWPTFSPALSS